MAKTPQCPRDVREEDFRQMLLTIPKGFVLKKTKPHGFWRDFVFRYEGERNHKLESYGFKRGDDFETALVRNPLW